MTGGVPLVRMMILIELVIFTSFIVGFNCLQRLGGEKRLGGFPIHPLSFIVGKLSMVFAGSTGSIEPVPHPRDSRLRLRCPTTGRDRFRHFCFFALGKRLPIWRIRRFRWAEDGGGLSSEPESNVSGILPGDAGFTGVGASSNKYRLWTGGGIRPPSDCPGGGALLAERVRRFLRGLQP
jgi:hypothetical protein